MSENLLKTVAESFSMSPDDLVEQGLKAFLQDQLALLDSEYKSLLTKHHVKTLDEFDNLIADNPDIETDLLPDFQRADFLDTRMEKMKDWISQLNGSR